MIISVKAARTNAHLKQVEMAEKMGIHVQTYRKIEEHPETATVKQAKQIAEITGCSLEDIFFDIYSTGGNVDRRER